jgi:hypothetical protein
MVSIATALLAVHRSSSSAIIPQHSLTTPNRHRTHVVREPSRVTTHVGHPLIIIICSTNHNQKLHSTTCAICCTTSPKSQERHCRRRLITARSHQSHKSVTAADVSSQHEVTKVTRASLQPTSHHKVTHAQCMWKQR